MMIIFYHAKIIKINAVFGFGLYCIVLEVTEW